MGIGLLTPGGDGLLGWGRLIDSGGGRLIRVGSIINSVRVCGHGGELFDIASDCLSGMFGVGKSVDHNLCSRRSAFQFAGVIPSNRDVLATKG